MARDTDPKVEKTPVPVVSTDKIAPQLRASQRVTVDAIFQNDVSVRHAITENLKALRAESKEVAARVERAWKFSPSQLSAKELASRHFVAPGADPAKMLETVINKALDEVQSSNTQRILTLHNSDDLKSLIKMNPTESGSLQGTVDLEPLVNFITTKQNAQSAIVAEPVYTLCKAEVEAKKILANVDKTSKKENGRSEPGTQDSSSKNREVDLLVKDAVNLQMKSATAPEAQLQYSSIPNSADKDKVQSSILQTFELRPGASDVTSYHDFNSLQIAFAHVWTRLFDGQLDSLGRELYYEYVKLKDFAGSTEPDLSISTLADLKKLIEEVRSLTVFTEDALPGSGNGPGDTSSQTQPKTPRNWIDDVKLFIPPDPASRLTFEFINWVINTASDAGKKPRLRWTDFDGRQLPRPQDKIIATFERNVADSDKVEVALVRRQDQRWRSIEFQQFDPSIGSNPFFRAMISNNPKDPALQFNGGPPNDGRPIVLDTSQLSSGLLEFASQDGAPSEVKLGRYLLGDLESLEERTRVTFDWIEG